MTHDHHLICGLHNDNNITSLQCINDPGGSYNEILLTNDLSIMHSNTGKYVNEYGRT